MNHPTLPRPPAVPLLTRLRAAWGTFRSTRTPAAPADCRLSLPPWEADDLVVPTYVCAALHIQPGTDRTILSLGTLQTSAPPHTIEAAFLGHLVNHDPTIKAQRLLHVCSVPAGQVNPYPIQP